MPFALNGRYTRCAERYVSGLVAKAFAEQYTVRSHVSFASS
jgi:hypothetical protein